MQDATVGRVIRLLRRKKGWRQQDLADRAGVSQGMVSLMERGRIDRVSVRAVRAVLGPLDANAFLDVRWIHGILDRLLDEDHAALSGAVAAQLAAWGWEVNPEVWYSVFGERGSIDLLAWHAPSRTLLIIEIKTELVSVEATLRKHDEKVRLGPRIAAERFGWRALAVGAVVVLPSDRTERRRVDRHAAVLVRALPARGLALRRWLQRPMGTIAGLWFVTPTNGSATTRARDNLKRARRPSSNVRSA